MGKDRKKIQKKKAQKAAKQKAKKAQHKKPPGSRTPLALRGALQTPVYQCWEPIELFDQIRGLGSVIITRKAEHHNIVVGVFLIDAFCLGIKDAFIKLMPEEEYRQLIQQIKTHEGLRKTSPERARKLIEEAEAYARELGFTPHKDYQTAKKIFGDIDPGACPDTFEFGRDGMPVYIAGPHDSRRFRERVIRTLTQKLGQDGFHYVMPMGDDVPPDFFE
jgi:hypothetical protein